MHLKISFTGHYAWPNFAGFNCSDFHIRWIQLVVEFFQVFIFVISLLSCVETVFNHSRG